LFLLFYLALFTFLVNLCTILEEIFIYFKSDG